MNLNKKDIVKNIIRKSSLSSSDGSAILESLLSQIIGKAKSNSVKLSSFGTFSFKLTPERIGRNPQKMDSYIIPQLNKLNFKASNKIKRKLN
jgi:integration host factor subunit alpha